MSPYYNTNKESGATLTESKKKALTQTEMIAEFFKANPNRSFTPFEVRERVLSKAPITSVRRAMTDLTAEGIIEKTAIMTNGEYNKTNHNWRLRKPAPVSDQMKIFFE